MPGKWFRCPDGQTIEIAKCQSTGGCRLGQRCATRAYLALVGYDRPWKGVSPSSAGTGPRAMYLKATTNYIINPEARVYATFGTAIHEKLSDERFTDNVLAEEPLSDGEIEGTTDHLEADEEVEGMYILSDYKTAGNFKVAKWLGIRTESVDEPLFNTDGSPVLLKSGKNKGTQKTKKKTTKIIEPLEVDIRAETLQLNRYRIMFEAGGFPISRMQIQAIPRDGGTFVAINRGIDRKIYLIPIKRMVNNDVLEFYRKLSEQVQEAFDTGYTRKCTPWESWDGRRCDKYCEVREACFAMSRANGQKTGII